VTPPRIPPVVAQPPSIKPTPLFNDDVMECRTKRKPEKKIERNDFKKRLEDLFKKITEWFKKQTPVSAPPVSARPPVSALPPAQQPPKAEPTPPVAAEPPKPVSVPLPVAPPSKPVFDYAAV
jgi:hypothetical protein